MRRTMRILSILAAVLGIPSVSPATTGLLSGDSDPVYTWRIRDAQGRVIREMKSEFGPNGNELFTWRRDFIYGAGRLIASDGVDGAEFSGRLLAYHTDHLGTPRIIIDENGEYSEHHYFPFGEELTGWFDDIPLKYTSHERDFDDLDYMRARYYRPSLGRFMAVDPLQDGWNRYVYANNDPVGRADFSGLRSDDSLSQKLFRPLSKLFSFRSRAGFGVSGKVSLVKVNFEAGKENDNGMADPFQRKIDDRDFGRATISFGPFGLGCDADAGGCGVLISVRKGRKKGPVATTAGFATNYKEPALSAQRLFTVEDLRNMLSGNTEALDIAHPELLNVSFSGMALFGGEVEINGSTFLRAIDQEFPQILDGLIEHSPFLADQYINFAGGSEAFNNE